MFNGIPGLCGTVSASDIQSGDQGASVSGLSENSKVSSENISQTAAKIGKAAKEVKGKVDKIKAANDLRNKAVVEPGVLANVVGKVLGPTAKAGVVALKELNPAMIGVGVAVDKAKEMADAAGAAAKHVSDVVAAADDKANLERCLNGDIPHGFDPQKGIFRDQNLCDRLMREKNGSISQGPIDSFADSSPSKAPALGPVCGPNDICGGQPGSNLDRPGSPGKPSKDFWGNDNLAPDSMFDRNPPGFNGDPFGRADKEPGAAPGGGVPSHGSTAPNQSKDPWGNDNLAPDSMFDRNPPGFDGDPNGGKDSSTDKPDANGDKNGNNGNSSGSSGNDQSHDPFGGDSIGGGGLF